MSGRPVPALPHPRPWRSPRALVLLVPLVAACAAGRNGNEAEGRGNAALDTPPERAAAPLAECVTGVVVAEGVDLSPRTWVRPPEAEPVELLGQLAGNVRLLAGATVQVCGPGRTPSGALEVTELELLQVDGMPAVLGRLRALGEGGWMIETLSSSEPVTLLDVPEGLTPGADRVVWAAGVRTEDRLAVRSYGLLRGWR